MLHFLSCDVTTQNCYLGCAGWQVCHLGQVRRGFQRNPGHSQRCQGAIPSPGGLLRTRLTHFPRGVCVSVMYSSRLCTVVRCVHFEHRNQSNKMVLETSNAVSCGGLGGKQLHARVEALVMRYPGGRLKKLDDKTTADGRRFKASLPEDKGPAAMKTAIEAARAFTTHVLRPERARYLTCRLSCSVQA
eukprot:352483-Chlamydomonas_euryale.AAC.5